MLLTIFILHFFLLFLFLLACCSSYLFCLDILLYFFFVRLSFYDFRWTRLVVRLFELTFFWIFFFSFIVFLVIVGLKFKIMSVVSLWFFFFFFIFFLDIALLLRLRELWLCFFFLSLVFFFIFGMCDCWLLFRYSFRFQVICIFQGFTIFVCFSQGRKFAWRCLLRVRFVMIWYLFDCRLCRRRLKIIFR